MSQTADFERCKQYISDALEYADTHTLEDVRLGIEAGRYQLWCGPNSAVVTEIVQAPQRRTFHIFLAGGKLPELEAMQDMILAWGAARGCTRATMLGRPGWTRSFLMRTGWQPTAVLCEKTLHGTEIRR